MACLELSLTSLRRQPEIDTKSIHKDNVFVSFYTQKRNGIVLDNRCELPLRATIKSKERS